MCTPCNICFVPKDRQTGRVVNIDTDTESNDGCVDHIGISVKMPSASPNSSCKL